jgi:hypothetical protein
LSLHTIPLNQTFERVQEWLPHFVTFAHRRNAQAIWNAIQNGTVQIHLVEDEGRTVAAIGTRIFDHETGRIGDLMWVGGQSRPAILKAIPPIEAFLREQGCVRVIVTGRLSLARVMKPLGYAPTQVTLEKALV